MAERTLSIIKPNAVKAGNIGNILAHFEKAGIRIVALKMMRLGKQQAEAFYTEHKKKPFFDNLVSFISSGPICALVLECNNVIEKNRQIMGSTNPAEAAPGTLRALYANNMTENAVHGSDSPTSAAREIAFFFGEIEIDRHI